MSEQSETPTPEPSADGDVQQATAEQQAAAWMPAPPPPEPAAQGYAADAFADRPELLVGAAFAGGMLAALILRRLAR